MSVQPLPPATTISDLRARLQTKLDTFKKDRGVDPDADPQSRDALEEERRRKRGEMRDRRRNERKAERRKAREEPTARPAKVRSSQVITCSSSLSRNQGRGHNADPSPYLDPAYRASTTPSVRLDIIPISLASRLICSPLQSANQAHLQPYSSAGPPGETQRQARLPARGQAKGDRRAGTLGKGRGEGQRR